MSVCEWSVLNVAFYILTNFLYLGNVGVQSIILVTGYLRHRDFDSVSY